MGNNCGCGCDDVGVPAGRSLYRPPNLNTENAKLELERLESQRIKEQN